MNDLLSQLRDIRGLDPVGWWPPAPGWWIVLALLALAAAIPYLLRLYKNHATGKWEKQMRERLKMLRTDNKKSAKQKAEDLSEILRLAAIRRHGRDACAGLSGHRWLRWLAEKDPKQYDWHKAVFLADAPFAPEDRLKLPDNWEELLKAAERWVR